MYTFGQYSWGLYNRYMIDFGVKQLHKDDEDGSRVYHLFDHAGSLKIVADYASPWLSAEHSDRYVRFASSSGKTIAQMDLAATAIKLIGGRQSKGYAIVLDHAVYAILSEYHVQDDEEERVYFVLHVGDSLWLILKEETEQPYFTIYNEVPANLTSRSREPMFSDLPESIGELSQDLNQYDYIVSWQEEGIKRLGILVLALVFLIDRL